MLRVVEYTQRKVDPNFKPNPKILSHRFFPYEDKALSQVRKWFGIYLGEKSKEDKVGKVEDTTNENDPPVNR